MSVNSSRVVEIFREKFSQYKNKNIILYGTGIYAGLLCKECTDFNIIGLMDGSRTDGYIWGKKILSYEEAVSLKADVIIIASKIISVKPIYQRILLFTASHGIAVYYLNGTAVDRLFEEFHRQKSVFFQINERTVKEEIDRHEIISFDIFDTLICRRTLYAEDVFELLESRACKNNLEVHNVKELRYRGIVDNPQRNPDIYEIYNKVAELAGLDENDKNRLLCMELEMEKNVLTVRENMVDLFQYAVEQRKKIYLVTDMYLTKEMIKDILDNLHITGYEDIFVSCEYRQLKQDGLFNTFRDRTGGNSYLHIGDNEDYDGIYAGLAGLDFLLIKSPVAMLRISAYSHMEGQAVNYNERTLLGMVTAKVFNNPFILYGTSGRPVVESAFELGYVFLGALLTAFSLWLTDEVRIGRVDDILFAARDGYLIQKLYRRNVEILRLRRMPEGIYFLTSRPACMSAGVENEEDIRQMLIAPFRQSPPQVLQNKFHLTEEELLPYDADSQDLVTYALLHKEQIIRRSLELRQNYLKYIDSLKISREKKYGFFDFVSRGSCQFYLSRIVSSNFLGMYFWRSLQFIPSALRNMQIHSFWDSEGEEAQTSYLSRHYLLLETVVTSQEPSLCKIDGEGKAVYCEELRTNQERRFIAEVQDAITAFCEEYVLYYYIEGQEIGKKLVDSIYQLIDKNYTDIDSEVFQGLMLVDDWILERVPLDR